MAEKKTTPVADLSFEAALAELERVVGTLESGDATLEDSISLYARGAELRGHCEAKLKEAEQQVSKITQAADGSVDAQPVDIG